MSLVITYCNILLQGIVILLLLLLGLLIFRDANLCE